MARDNTKRKQNRKLEHQRARWGCKNTAGCGFVFPAELLLKSHAADRRRKGWAGPLTNVCGRCNTFHFLREDLNGVRLLTPAETLRLYVEMPAQATAAETYRPTVNEIHVCNVEE